MSAEVSVCKVDDQVEAKLKKFRFRKEKTTAALIFKVKDNTIVLDEVHEDISVDDLQEELPSTQPRFIVLSYEYKHKDGRISYPLCFIHLAPVGCNNKLNMEYAGSKRVLQNLSGISKCFEIRSIEEFTEEWLIEKLEFFR